MKKHKPYPMVTIRSPNGKRTETLDRESLPSCSKKALERAGYAGWKRVCDHDDKPPPHPDMSDEEKERCRRMTLNRHQMMDELLAEIAELRGRVEALERK